ncbi:MAG: hypothetical protein H6Q99_1832, partial [Proteobacteria bacterium]|nr:hypothetical protein [Pseudomonadota bacterium]
GARSGARRPCRFPGARRRAGRQETVPLGALGRRRHHGRGGDRRLVAALAGRHAGHPSRPLRPAGGGSRPARRRRGWHQGLGRGQPGCDGAGRRYAQWRPPHLFSPAGRARPRQPRGAAQRARHQHSRAGRLCGGARRAQGRWRGRLSACHGRGDRRGAHRAGLALCADRSTADRARAEAGAKARAARSLVRSRCPPRPLCRQGHRGGDRRAAFRRQGRPQQPA